jgi:acyl-coenzyme A synthetase/AMP-(fatty) acid ligase
VPDDPQLAAICLGAPMPNILFLVEDAEDDVAGGACGTLCIGGAQTALGIVGEGPGSRTGARFFERRIDGALRRFYATGDQVRLEPVTGELRFRGRQDNQIKLNGVRIELEEVEAAIASVDMVEECIAFVARRGENGLLCAAYRTLGNVPLAPAIVRRACASLLPSPFVPARMMQVDRLPLTASGKHDRASLAADLASIA